MIGHQEREQTDAHWIRRCVELAVRAAGRTSPNPAVGCVILSPSGEVLAEGFHERAGLPHAEAVALARLDEIPRGRERARGGTLYVNLEPCAHRGGRKTEPCAPKVAASGVARLVYGLADPFPGHGGGAREVAAAGVDVTAGVEEDLCRRLNEPFVTWATQGRAHVTLKTAMTLDGRIATRAGESRWISGAPARAEVHELRDRLDAILVGAGTVAADDPLLTVRGLPGGRDPVRVVLDGGLKTSPDARLLHSGSPAPTWFATTRAAPERRGRKLAAAGAEVWRLPSRRGARDLVDVRALLRALAKRGLLSVLVEGGAEVHAAFLEARVVDRVILYVAPIVVGGPAPAWLGGDGVKRLRDAWGFRFDGPPRFVGDDLRLELVPR